MQKGDQWMSFLKSSITLKSAPASNQRIINLLTFLLCWIRFLEVLNIVHSNRGFLKSMG